MAKDDAIRRERLDRSYSVWTEQPLKTREFALALQHKPDNGAFGRWLAGPHDL
ncbi:MAG TPA: hypothetical protein VES65_07155 [Solirubrobacteraceae bacterium]|nr:hypothetical protein [Solirubrobacteraceae bacterium]